MVCIEADITGHAGLVRLPHYIVKITFQIALTFERPGSDTQLCTARQKLSITRQT